MSKQTNRRLLVQRKPSHTAFFEPLESRQYMSVTPTFYSFNGSGNNLSHNTWGAAGTDLIRKSGTAYGDGISTMAGADRPNARALSNILATQIADPEPNSRNMSDMIYSWGQFIDHDLDLTPAGGAYSPITIPFGDGTFVGGSQMPFSRSTSDPLTGTSKANPLNQPNVVTSFLDGSMVYGSDATRAMALRTMHGGLLKTSAGDLLPINTGNLPVEIHIPGTDPKTLFAAGDIRVNENSELVSIQVLFLREHNYWATQLAKTHPTWTDQQLYDNARQIVIAEIQNITYNEFLPALLGKNAITAYTGYNPSVNPGVSAEFSEAAYRMGHSLVNISVDFFANDGSESHAPIDFNASADNPAALQGGPGFEGAQVDYVLKYLVADIAEEADNQIEDPLRNQLFAPGHPSFGGLDLYALDVQRGRDVGLPDYNSVRLAMGLQKVISFNQISSDPAVVTELRQAYGTHFDTSGKLVDNVDDIDLFVGGLSENHVSGGSLGATFTRIIADQFQRTRDGDRLWYTRLFSGTDLKQIQQTTLNDIIRRNTFITNLQANAFFFTPGTLSGHVFVDANADGSYAKIEAPLTHILVTLMDAKSHVIATQYTAADGTFHFDHLPLGKTYKVFSSVWGKRATNASLKTINMADSTGAGEFDVNFGVV